MPSPSGLPKYALLLPAHAGRPSVRWFRCKQASCATVQAICGMESAVNETSTMELADQTIYLRGPRSSSRSVAQP